ncbi:MAG TPA: hypothetical protein VFH92_09960 [Phenylobacterium sp.]|nr:hypothetical protein [Phenylobacterium sp.]
MKQLFVFCACAALLAACSPSKPAAPKAPHATAAAAKFNTDLPMPELMGHMVDPAAFMYWKGSGTEVTAKGERDLAPAPNDQEGWDTLVSGATILWQAGNVLQLPGNVRAPEADWMKYAQLLTERAVIAREAAEKRDKKAVFEEGAKLYEVCVACHEEYVIQPALKANGPAKGNPLPDFPADIKARMAKAQAQTPGK